MATWFTSIFRNCSVVVVRRPSSVVLRRRPSSSSVVRRRQSSVVVRRRRHWRFFSRGVTKWSFLWQAAKGHPPYIHIYMNLHVIIHTSLREQADSRGHPALYPPLAARCSLKSSRALRSSMKRCWSLVLVRAFCRDCSTLSSHACCQTAFGDVILDILHIRS